MRKEVFPLKIPDETEGAWRPIHRMMDQLNLHPMIFCLVALFLTSSWARADFYLHPWQDFHGAGQSALLSVDLFVYSTRSNFYPNLGTASPTGFNQYNRIENDDIVQYGVTDRLTLYGRLTWMRAQVSSTPDTTFFPGTAFGLGDQTVGASYRIYGPDPDRLGIDLQLQVDFPAYSNSSSAQDQIPFLGDGSVDTTVGAFGDLPLTLRGRYDLRLLAGAGYTYRSAGFSSAIPWSAEARLSFNKAGNKDGNNAGGRAGRDAGGDSFDETDEDNGPGSSRSYGPSIALGFNGIQSLQTDTRQPLAGPVGATTGAGGSFIVNAINPSIINLNGDLGYQARDDLRLALFGQLALTGQNAPDGFATGAAFQMRFGGREKGGGTSEKEEASHQGDRNAGNSDSQNPGAYNLDADVIRANDRFNVVKIGKGSHDGIEVGDIFDLFAPSSQGKRGPAIARAHATHVRADQSVLQVDEYYHDTWIDEGFTARRLSQ